MIKSKLKKEIIDYYDMVKSEIDIRSQEILFNQSIDDAKKKDTFDVYTKMIAECEQLFEKNIVEINDYFEKVDLLEELVVDDADEIKTNILSGYCSFVRNDLLKDDLKLKNKIGILFITDWYMDKNQLNYLKYV
jgi:hypothetical protein